MDNLYLQEQVARMRREDMLARSEHERLMAENGLDLWSVVKRAVAERLFKKSAPAELHLVSRAQLERRVERAA
jgi:hypothetical protein